jgi:hypothetical protein
LEFLDKRGRSHGPGLVLVTRYARIVVDLKKSPKARGDMIRIRINELGIADLLESESDIPDSSVVQGQGVSGADCRRVSNSVWSRLLVPTKSQQSGPADFPHPFSLGSEPGHNLLHYSEHDERASSARGVPSSDVEYGTRNGSRAKISPVHSDLSVAPHTGSKPVVLQATPENGTHENPTTTGVTFPAKVCTFCADRRRANHTQVRRGLENGSGDTKLPRRQRYLSDEEKQVAIREGLDGQIERDHAAADQKAMGKMNDEARKGERQGESLERVRRTVTCLFRPELNRIGIQDC